MSQNFIGISSRRNLAVPLSTAKQAEGKWYTSTLLKPRIWRPVYLKYSFYQLTTNYFTCPYASPNSKLLSMVGNVTKSDNQTVIINRHLYVASESTSANSTSMEARVATSAITSKMPIIMCLKANMLRAVLSSATHCDESMLAVVPVKAYFMSPSPF